MGGSKKHFKIERRHGHGLRLLAQEAEDQTNCGSAGGSWKSTRLRTGLLARAHIYESGNFLVNLPGGPHID